MRLLFTLINFVWKMIKHFAKCLWRIMKSMLCNPTILQLQKRALENVS